MHFLATIGLGCFFANEENFGLLVKWLEYNGQVFPGYSGKYYYAALGYAEFILHLTSNNRVCGFSSHVMSDDLWTMVISDGRPIELREDSNEQLHKCLRFHQKGKERKSIPIRLVHADVLPCYSAGETVYMQVAAFPREIHYYKDVQTWAERNNRIMLGQPLCISGNIVGSSRRHSILSRIVATIKSVEKLPSRNINDEPVNFYHVTVETCFGDLGIYHTAELVDAEERQYLTKGACVDAHCVIQGDVAIGEYEDGAVYDEEHCLKLLKNCYDTGDFSRSRDVFAENVQYINGNKEQYVAKKQMPIILQALVDKDKTEGDIYQTYLGTIEKYFGSNNNEKAFTGRQAILHARGKTRSLRKITCIETDNDGRICKLALQKINDYAVSVKEEQHFQADEYLYLNLLKEALDSGDCSKLLNYLEHNIKFISEDTSTTILCYAVLDALQRLTAGKDTGNSTAQTFLVKITGRKTAADSQTIKTGQQALAVSRGGFQEIDLLLTIEIVQNKIVALQFVHGSNYMLEELEPLKEICLHNRQSLAVPLTGCSIEEWAAFFQDWAEGRTGGQNGLQQLYAALADHCKMTILGKCRSPYGLMVKNVNNKEAICQRLQEFMRTAGKCLKDEGNILIWNDFELLFVVDANGRIAGLQIQLRKELAGPLR